MKILLLGKDGQVGWELQRTLAPLGTLVACGRDEANLEDLDGLRGLIAHHRPDVIVNAAAYTAVDKAESEPDKARAVNAHAVGMLAQQAADTGAWLIHYSTDYVFDGEKTAPYVEDDPTGPLSVYGRTKLEGEQLIRQSGARHLIFRTSWVYATRGGNFAKTMLRLAHEKDTLSVVDDQHGAPTSAALIADISALALYRVARIPDAEPLAGTYHLAAAGTTSWHEYAKYVLELARAAGAGLKAGPDDVKPIPTAAYPVPATRPKNSQLDTAKLVRSFDLRLPEWQYHVRRLVDTLAAQQGWQAG
jgi:dTDP-4-dehydrorhamnose reductase